jgi:hypothetical protein
MLRGRVAEQVYEYVLRHPSIRRGLEDGIVSASALARWIGDDQTGRSSHEALSVGVRRSQVLLQEQRGLTTAHLPLGETWPVLYPGYRLARFRDLPATWKALAERVDDLLAALESPRAFLAIQQGAPSLLLLAAASKMDAVLAGVPEGLREASWEDLTVAGIDMDTVAPETPGVIEYLDDLLARINLNPRLMVGVGQEFRWVGSPRDVEGVVRALGQIPSRVSAGAKAAPAWRRRRAESMANAKEVVPSAAEVAREYIAQHPSVADCLAYGIVNVTLLARRISEELHDPRVDALEMAIRRYPVTQDPATTSEQRLLDVVGASRVEVRTRVALVSIAPSPEFLRTILSEEAMEARSQRRLFQILQGPSQATILCESEYVNSLRELAKSRHEPVVIWDGLTAITVESPREVYETPGVVAYLAGTLSRQRINCVELMSLHTESTFVVQQADAPRAFQALSELVFDPRVPAPSGARLPRTGRRESRPTRA